MGFRGGFAPTGVAGAFIRTENQSVFVTAGVSADTIALPAGASRWRVYRILVSLSGFIWAHATQDSNHTIRLEATDSLTGTLLGAINSIVGAGPGGSDSANFTGELIAVDAGVLLSEGAGLTLSLSDSGSGGLVQRLSARAWESVALSAE